MGVSAQFFFCRSFLFFYFSWSCQIKLVCASDVDDELSKMGKIIFFRNFLSNPHCSSIFSSILKPGSSCSTAVELTPYNREVVGSIPARCGAFSSTIFSTVSLKKVPRVGTALLFFRNINAQLCGLGQNKLNNHSLDL